MSSGVGGGAFSARVGTGGDGGLGDLEGLLRALANGTGGAPGGVSIQGVAAPHSRNLFEVLTQVGTILEVRTAATLADSNVKLNSDTIVGGTLTVNGTQIALGNAAGASIPQNTGQKLGFWGKTPVIQQARPVDLPGVIALLALLGLSA